MNVLAIDLGTNCGWCFSGPMGIQAGTWKLATPKEVTAQAKLRMDRRCDVRINRLWCAVASIHATYPLNVLLFEDVQFASTTKQAHLWASLRAVLWLFASLNGILIECVPTGTLKLFATGHGGADKQMMEMHAIKYTDVVESREGKTYLKSAPTQPLDDNAIDALHLLKWATKNLRSLPLNNRS